MRKISQLSLGKALSISAIIFFTILSLTACTRGEAQPTYQVFTGQVFTGCVHIHTTYSWDVRDEKATPENVVKKAEELGLDFIIITDHNTTEGAIQAKEFAEGNEEFQDLLVIVCEEVTCDWGHILACGLQQDISPPGPGACDLSPGEVMERIREAGAFAIAAHPWRGWRDPSPQRLGVDAYEVVNGRDMNTTWAPEDLLSHFAFVGSSDAHVLEDVGCVWNYVLATELSEQAIWDAIRHRRVCIQTVDGLSICDARYLNQFNISVVPSSLEAKTGYE